ncbi:NUDIX hydrolase [Solimonas sp. SE-A11]|uniref:NUDIX hydrolase n=1 Tax=Solimonas sp. SE-A11 TaxID=3054954 RepID=UPI00259CD52D|nr:NUDIX hydrolase [Solimonas sp. SE-A11]MDM4772247.1 NUDIX hydrolase [Solimonas sp. SE-A11]
MSWTPHVVVACVVERDGRFLLVEERIAGEMRMNQPAGHWEQGETLVQGAIRETLEESAWDVEPTHVLGLYHHDPVDLGYGFLRIAFIAKALRERPNHQLDEGIERAVWLTRDEIAASVALHRSPMVLRCVDDYLAGQRFPLSMLAHLD